MIKKKNDPFPSKKTLNLAIQERSEFAPDRLVPMLAVVVIAVLLFSKFAVVDRLAQVSDAQAQLNQKYQQITALQNATAEFDAVNEEYGHYSVSWMTDEEKALLDRTDILDLIEVQLMPVGQVGQFSMSGNVLAVDLVGITLNDVSKLVETLYTLPEVEEVAVYHVNNQQQEETVVSMIIELAQPTEGGEQT